MCLTQQQTNKKKHIGTLLTYKWRNCTLEILQTMRRQAISSLCDMIDREAVQEVGAQAANNILSLSRMKQNCVREE